MKKKSFKFLSLSALVCSGVLVLGSCGGDPEPKPEDAGTYQIVADTPKQALSLSEKFVKRSDTSKYFAPQIVQEVATSGEPELKYLTNGGEALLLSGQKAQIFGYDVPKEWKIGCTIMDADGLEEDTSGKVIKVSESGEITAATVTEKSEAIIRFYATSPTANLEYEGQKYADSVRQDVKIVVIPQEQLAADGAYRYDGLTPQERTTATAALERFSMKNGLTGVTLSQNGGYVVYNERLKAPLLDRDAYLPGYGFGTDLYGEITADLEKERTEKYKRYVHEWNDVDSDQGVFNYLNSSEAAVSDYYSRISTGYFYTPLNEDMSAYEYRGNLARVDAPEALNMTESGTATRWKIKLRVGADTTDPTTGATKGLTYRINSKVPQLKAFDGRKVKLDDYLTPFKLLSMKSVGWYRGAEFAAEKTANRQIKGLSEFYQGSGTLDHLPTNEEFSRAVGVSIDSTDNSITIEMNAGISQDFAIYQLDTLWSNPIPAEFIETLGTVITDGPSTKATALLKGADYYGTSPSTYTPLDTMLSVGPYYTESYEHGVLATFAKNEDWFLTKDNYDRSLFKIPGYHVKASSKMKDDENATIMAFENGEVDSSNIPDSYWDKYKTSPLRKKVSGTRQQKLTFNTSDKCLHDRMFGKGGPWYERFNQGKFEPWEVKPISSNRSFFMGLNCAVDRVAFADKYHVVPSIDYQAPTNKVTPTYTELYNSSKEHKDVVSSIYGDALKEIEKTMTYAVSFMDIGIQQELEAGHYDLGTGEKPTVVTMTVGVIDEQVRKDRLALIEANWKDAFLKAVQSHKDRDGKNHWVDSKGKPKIVFDLVIEGVPGETSFEELIQNGLWIGKWDVQYSYIIEGNGFDVLNGMDILMSTKMAGFELNFGVDTRLPSADIYYDNKYWSFESLWAATQGGVLIDKEGFQVDEFLEFGEEAKDLATGSETTSTTGASVDYVTFKLDVTHAYEGYEVAIVGDTAIAVKAEDSYKAAASPWNVTLSEDGKSLLVKVPVSALLDAVDFIGDETLVDNYCVNVMFKYSVTKGGQTVTFDADVYAVFEKSLIAE